jgi:hypothetical protein
MPRSVRESLARFPSILGTPEGFPREERRIRAFLGRVVQAATLHPPGTAVHSAIACAASPWAEDCPGRLVLRRSPEGGPVEWSCPVCGLGGEIGEWAGSDWDASDAVRPGNRTPVHLLPQEWRLLDHDLVLLDPELERLLAAATWDEGGAMLRGSRDEYLDLLDFLEHEAAMPGRLRRRVRILALAERIGLQLPPGPPPG